MMMMMQSAKDLAEIVNVDDHTSRLRLLPAEACDGSVTVAKSCSDFRARVSHFQNLVKELLSQVSENAKKVETAKLCAIGSRNMLLEEIDTRPRKLRDQQRAIAEKEEQIKNLKEEFDSLMSVKKEQDLLISWLIDPTLKPASS